MNNVLRELTMLQSRWTFAENVYYNDVQDRVIFLQDLIMLMLEFSMERDGEVCEYYELFYILLMITHFSTKVLFLYSFKFCCLLIEWKKVQSRKLRGCREVGWCVFQVKSILYFPLFRIITIYAKRISISMV